jgi:outer membrane protein OmpA-like peptidoglycan-associated protein
VEVALIGAVMALILLAQDSTREMVVVVPSADGHVGAVVVERGEDRIILDEAYATSRITRGGEIRLERVPQGEVASNFEPAVKALPEFAPAVKALPERPALYYLYFVTGTDVLTDASKNELARMLEELRRRTTPDIVVTGHTDRVGNEEANDGLSLARAERVRNDLVIWGIAPERISTAGRGERDPIVPTDDDVDEPLNRRVEIDVR